MSDNRKYVFIAVIILIGVVYISRLFAIQVTDSNYKLAAENNIIQRTIQYPFRGLIHDRNGKILVENEPVFDIMTVPKEVDTDQKEEFCQLVNLEPEKYDELLQKAKRFSYVKPSIFLKQLPFEEFAALQDHLVDFKGFYVSPRTVRAYPHKSAASALGYIGEISKTQLEKPENSSYEQGDFIGKSGLEAQYEPQMKGVKGISYQMVNVRGVVKGKFKDGEYDTMSAPGSNIQTSIDLELQQYAEWLMEGKRGSVVAIEPGSGEILTFISAPSYDPNILTGRDFPKNYQKLLEDTLKPLFIRPLMSPYPPGSIFKLAQALIALEEGVIFPYTRITCNRNIIACHGAHIYEDLRGAIQHSCNPYFRETFRRIINQKKDENTYKDSEIGLEVWNKHIRSFGFGSPLGIDIPNEKGGFIPGPEYYDKLYGDNRWKFSTIYSLAIGQGEISIVPIQMANLAAILANRGYYYTPHFIKQIGDSAAIPREYYEKNYTSIDTAHFPVVIEAMGRVVKEGTGLRANVPGIDVCGKTGTAENPHGEDHSVFIAFAPQDDPQIAVSILV
jgi:penicillin-binding protein 2